MQYSDIASVCKAIKKMDGEYLGSNRLKVGFLQKTIVTYLVYLGFQSNVSSLYNMHVLFLLEAWIWEEYAHNMRLARWFGNQYYRAIPHSAFLPLWTCS